MFSDKVIPVEAAYIAEELLQGSEASELDRRCLVIKQCLQDGDFTLEEALEVYGVSKADFESFMAKYVISELQSTFAQMEPRKQQVILTIDVVAEICRQLFISVDKDAVDVLHHFEVLSKQVEEDEVLV
jgi:hypothetical protein